MEKQRSSPAGYRLGYGLGKAATWLFLLLIAVGACCRGVF
jgi:hypothetical protein